MEEKTRDDTVKVIGNYRVASFLIKKGYKIVNIKKYRGFICDITNLPCDYRTVFTFLIENDFLKDLEFAKLNYDDIKKED